MTRILSIEDSADLQQLIGTALQAKGYEVHYAFNGKEGYEKVLSLDPDLVLLDLMIPQMNGVAVIERLKAARQTRDIPILIISAYGDDGDMLGQSLVALGAVEYIRKPFEMQALLRRVENALAASPRKPAAPRELRKGTARLNLKYRTVWIDDQMAAQLAHKPLKLLQTLMEAKSEVARDALIRHLWPEGGASPNALEKTVERLRKALGPHGRRLQTRPDGYEFVG